MGRFEQVEFGRNIGCSFVCDSSRRRRIWGLGHYLVTAISVSPALPDYLVSAYTVFLVVVFVARHRGVLGLKGVVHWPK